MKKIKLNREFAMRHIGVALLMLGLGGWFGYDGFVDYPKHDDAWFEARHLRRDNAIQRQKEFMSLAFLAAILIGGHVFWVSLLRVEYDDEGFIVAGGEKKRYVDIKCIDRSKWTKDGIVKIDGLKLDAWHHTGVREIYAHLAESSM